MTEPESKIKTVEDMVATRERLRAEGKTVVQCHGCFDIVHPGHIRYLKFARELGDYLVVSVSADAVVNKGDERPYISEELRLENLAAFEFVDAVCLDHGDWAGDLLAKLTPDVYVKGREYETKGDPRFAREREIVEGYGGKVVFSSGAVVYSSTHIISQFRERFALEYEKLKLFCRRHGVTREAMARTVRAFTGKRVLVIGDAILDHYVHCDALGVASETPILSVSPISDEWFVGAGALIAVQIAELGGEAGFLTVLRGGDECERFRREVRARGVALHDVRDEHRPVFVKTRYLVDEQKVFKVDKGLLAPPSTQATRELVSRLEAMLPEYDALVVTDFGYGLFGAALIDAVSRVTKATGTPYYLDVSHTRRANILRFSGARLATPTEQELRFAFADMESGLSNLASRFYQETDTEQLILTMGKRGVLLFGRAEGKGARLPTDFLPALGMTTTDTIGAGDVFLAGATLVDLTGAPIEHAAYLGSSLSALHIARLGNEAVSYRDLDAYLLDREELGQ